MRLSDDVDKSGSTTEGCNVRTAAVDQGTQQEDRAIVRTAVAAPTLSTIQQLADRYDTYPSHPYTDMSDYSGVGSDQLGIALNGDIVFSDESRFLLCPDDLRKRVWRRLGQRVDPGLTLEHHTGPKQGVMVWGAILVDNRTLLVVIPGTLTAQRELACKVEEGGTPEMEHRDTTTIEEIQENALEQMTGDLTDKDEGGLRPGTILSRNHQERP
ncbi:hypothetical protein LAZ67_16002723 [Cordylochernes scorpioides]|uniref:Uncharacterized protein n=1 Tax=Cordylochernes scorpioides TaxID=51811 RepID=A0ABY6LH09_9ARAC|nr:hypothetical protein LAZ67_16002723 [Cordylochernes scorpioides]